MYYEKCVVFLTTTVLVLVVVVLLAPPRDFYFYCWLHEWNNTHNEVFVGKIMRTNQAYTVHTVHSRDEKRGAYRCRHGRQPQNWGTGITPRPPNCFNPFTHTSTYFIFSPPLSQASSVTHPARPNLRAPVLPASALPALPGLLLVASALPVASLPFPPFLPNDQWRHKTLEHPPFPRILILSLCSCLIDNRNRSLRTVRKVIGGNHHPSFL